MGNLFDELRRVFPHVEPRPCRKIGYLTWDDAQAHLDDLKTKPDCVEPQALVVYRCHGCGQYHVGHRKELLR